MNSNNRSSYTSSPTLRGKKPFWQSHKKNDTKKATAESVTPIKNPEPTNHGQLYFSNDFSNQGQSINYNNKNFYQTNAFYPPQYNPYNNSNYAQQGSAGNPFLNTQKPTIEPAVQRQYIQPQQVNKSNKKKTKNKNSKDYSFFTSFKHLLGAFLEWIRLPQVSSFISLFIIIPLLFGFAFATNSVIAMFLFFVADISAIIWILLKKPYSDGTRITLLVTGIAIIILIIINSITTPNKDSKSKSQNSTSIIQNTPLPVPTEMQNIGINVNAQQDSNSNVTASEAQLNFESFMSKWQNSDIEGMLEFVAPSWKSQQKDATQALFSLLLNRRPKEYTIEDINGSDADSARTITMRAEINKFTSDEYSIIRFQILMLKEQGIWYVDPSTLGTNIKPTVEASATPTMAPRTTVTPKPSEDTILYYNPDGGSKYHLNPECPSVNKKYLPLEPFKFAQIHEPPYNKLTNCLECNAPH